MKGGDPSVFPRAQLHRKERVKISMDRKTIWASNPDYLMTRTLFFYKDYSKDNIRSKIWMVLLYWQGLPFTS